MRSDKKVGKQEIISIGMTIFCGVLWIDSMIFSSSFFRYNARKEGLIRRKYLNLFRKVKMTNTRLLMDI